MAKQRNEQSRALRHRAGTADVAVQVDTRPKVIAPKRGKGSYRRKSKFNSLERGSY